ncbi:hypothetical protein ABKV19_022938 [Rosa sericea]
MKGRLKEMSEWCRQLMREEDLEQDEELEIGVTPDIDATQDISNGSSTESSSRVSILDLNKSTNPVTASFQEIMIDNIVVPVASSFGLGEDYNYLRRSIREFLTGEESGRMYVIDTKTDPKAPFLHKVVDPEDIVQKAGLAYPHTSHCLASGDFFSVT